MNFERRADTPKKSSSHLMHVVPVSISLNLVMCSLYVCILSIDCYIKLPLHTIHVYAAVYVIAAYCVADLHITMSGFDSSDEESGDFNLSQFPIWW